MNNLASLLGYPIEHSQNAHDLAPLLKTQNSVMGSRSRR